jgi:lipopolysaccharide/colanic/teichoic acid biosynthesis glycosyltransferase
MTRLRNMRGLLVNGVASDAVAHLDLMKGATGRADAAIPHPGAYLKCKLAIEWAAALVLIVIVSPLLAGLALLVKFSSPGPVFYSQLRLGRSGRRFRIHKLRTMIHDCEAATGPVWSMADDPRVTRVGRWLRDTHLDELPQLLNVLRGEMSLIGPRPERPEIAGRIEQMLPGFKHRLLVRPGMTGLSQMRMPADTDLHAVHRKLAHDLHYVRRIGFALDARIFLATVFYLLGAAAKAVSRQLLQPYVPPVSDQPPSSVPETSVATSDVTALDRSWAA